MDDDSATTVDATQGFLQTTVSRAQLLAAAGAGLAMITLPTAAGAASAGGTGHAARLEFPFFPQVQGTYTTENIRDILNVLDTLETFFVTYYTHALTAANLGLTGSSLATIQATLAIGQYHIDFLDSIGGHSLLTTFTPRNKPNPATIVPGHEGDATFRDRSLCGCGTRVRRTGSAFTGQERLSSWGDVGGIPRRRPHAG